MDFSVRCQVVVEVRSTRAKDFSARCQVVVAVRIKWCDCLVKTLWLSALQKNVLGLRVPDEGSAVRSSEPFVQYHTYQATW